MKTILIALSLLTITSAVAAESDLELPGARWAGKFTAYVCDQAGNVKAETAPTGFSERNIEFNQLFTDYSLDNVLVKATFTENNVACNYSAILFADNAAWTEALVESKAYAPAGGSECLKGKAVIDAALKFNKYAYLHGRIAIFSPITGSDVACGAGSTQTGLHFQATGKL